MMYNLIIQPPEGISTSRPEERPCLKPASTGSTTPLPPESATRTKSSRESLEENQDVHVQVRCTCTSSSSNSLSQNNNQQGRKEEKATANGAADILTDDGWVLNPIGDVGCSLFFAPCCNFQHSGEVAR